MDKLKEIFNKMNAYEWAMLIIILGGGFVFLITTVSQANANSRGLKLINLKVERSTERIIELHRSDILRIFKLQREHRLRNDNIRRANIKELYRKIDKNKEQIIKTVRQSQ